MRHFKSIKLRNILSFGEEQSLELGSLNILIGANASGKSNFLEVLRILKAIPLDLAGFLREGGGVNEYLWKGVANPPLAKIEVATTLRYRVEFTARQDFPVIESEAIEFAEALDLENPGFINDGRDFILRRKGQAGELRYLPQMSGNGSEPYQTRTLTDLVIDTPVIREIRDSRLYTELSHFENYFSAISFAGEWDLTRFSPLRKAQRLDLPTNQLLPDATNLGLVFLNYSDEKRKEITAILRAMYPPLNKIITQVHSGLVQIFIEEKELHRLIPMTRMSDGFLHYFCLTVLLTQPSLPRIICLDEPEVGLHPHAVYAISELLTQASAQSQLFVTTHSDALISGFTENPEAVIVCEHDESGTHLQRLNFEQLKPWLDNYALGDMWREGHVGGVPW